MPHTAIWRHRGYVDAANGIAISRCPATTVRKARAWVSGWRWYHGEIV